MTLQASIRHVRIICVGKHLQGTVLERARCMQLILSKTEIYMCHRLVY